MGVGYGVGLDVGTNWAIAVGRVAGAPVDGSEPVVEHSTSRLSETGTETEPGALPEDVLATATASLLVTTADRIPDLTGDPQVVATHPARWDAETVAAQRAAFDRAGLGPVRLVPDAVAAVAWLEATHGPLDAGVVAVFDLGAAGVTVSLVRVGDTAHLLPPSVYSTLFGGDSFDRMVLEHVLGSAAADLDPFDPSDPGTRAELDALRDRCRAAKEELSTTRSVTVPVHVAGSGTEVTVSRAELDELLHGPLAAALSLTEETVRAHEVDPALLRSVLLIGGGARLPALVELAATLPVPAVIAPDPDRVVARGAALLAVGALSADAEAVLAEPDPPLTAADTARSEADTDSLPVVPPTAMPTAYTEAGTGQPVRTAAPPTERRGRGPLIAAVVLAAIAIAAVTAAAVTALSAGTGGAPIPEVVTLEPPPPPTSTVPTTSTTDPTVEWTTTRPARTTVVATVEPRPPVVIPTTAPPVVVTTTTAPPTTTPSTSTPAPTTSSSASSSSDPTSTVAPTPSDDASDS